MEYFDSIIIGAGLAGLTTALELSENGKSVLVLEKHKVIGGRTASWDEDGMLVESGFHRHIGYYKELPAVLKKVGVDINEIVQWEEQIDVRVKGKKDTAVFGISPIYGPIELIRGMIGNNHILSLKDKLSMIRFFLSGFKEYLTNPENLDKYSVRDYAVKYHVSEDALHYMLVPLSAGIFFLPPKRYSALVFFGLFFPAIPRFYKMRIGAYLGGMTELLAKPIARGIQRYGGIINTDTFVNDLIVKDGSVKGVILENNSEITAEQVVIATNLGGAKRILKKKFAEHPSFKTMLSLPTMPAVTIQLELTKPVLPYDRTTFGPLTSLASFAEQSRSTFKHVPGRLSIILTPPERFLAMDREDILKEVISDAKKLGMDIEPYITDYRIVSHPEDFHSLEPNHNWMRPDQKTEVKGLYLAGDYTRQPHFATMEGAVVSGQKAARLILKEHL